MIEELKDVLELATSATSFVNGILSLKHNNKNQNQANAIISAKGNYAQIGSSGDSAQIGSSGDSAQIGSSGDSAQIGSSGYSAQIGSSGDSAQIGSSGNYAKIGSSGDSAKIGSSGNSAKIGSSGYSVQIGSSGDSAKIGSSGNSARIDSTGSNAVVSAIGINSIAKAKKGSWITLAEYEQDEDNNWVVSFVKTEYVDGNTIKENRYYTLFNKEFKEVEEIDGVKTVILKRKQNIVKGASLNNKTPCYIFEKDGIYAHGRTIKQAYLDWLFKTSDRDVNKYREINKEEAKDLNYWIIAYRTITGACSFGTNNYLENNKDKYKDKMTLQEVLTATAGQYGHTTFKEFFESNI